MPKMIEQINASLAGWVTYFPVGKSSRAFSEVQCNIGPPKLMRASCWSTARSAGPETYTSKDFAVTLGGPGGPGPDLPTRGDVCNDSARGAMSKIYVMKVEDTYRVAGTRISLDSLVYLYREGISPEGMVESYPTLTLEQVHGALAYYLANQKEIDHYLAQADAVAETQHQQSRRSNAELIAKLRRMRHANQIPG